MESISKERGEKLYLEEQNHTEVREALEILLEDWKWPEVSEEVSFLAEERLKWASRFALVMSNLKNNTPLKTIDLPDVAPKKWIIWLCFDVYELDVSMPKKWWDSSSFEDFHQL